jgi:hypothetical protein
MEHAAPSPLSAEVMGPIEKVTRDVFGPSVAVIPTMERAQPTASIPRCGIPGMASRVCLAIRTTVAHGKDERVLIKSYYELKNSLPSRERDVVREGHSVMRSRRGAARLIGLGVVGLIGIACAPAVGWTQPKPPDADSWRDSTRHKSASFRSPRAFDCTI